MVRIHVHILRDIVDDHKAAYCYILSYIIETHTAADGDNLSFTVSKA